MSETRTVHDPFFGKNVEISDRLVDRLRGRYAVGPTLPNGEPEFGWRQHDVPPIQKEAADEIDRLTRTIEIAWAAGVFEGEGSICGNAKFRTQLNQDGQRRKGGFRWELIMHMTDHDVIRKFHRVVGYGTIQGPYKDKRSDSYKPQLRWYIGNLEDCQTVLRIFFPFLGERRKQKAIQCLEAQYVRKRPA